MTTLQDSTTAPHAEAFEHTYADAGRDAALVPWSDGHPHRALVNWLNAVAPSLLRCGARVAVVGCGLGEDARELIRRGYDVTAFDASPTAVRWAQELDPQNAECYHTANLYDPPARWRHRFDLVVEINTIQALPIESRSATVGAIADLVAPRGRLLVICRGCEQPAGPDDGPPWPLTEHELAEAASLAGLVEDAPTSVFLDDETPPVKRMRALYRRS